MTRRALARRIAAAEAQAEGMKAEEARIDLSGLTVSELDDLRAAMLVRWSGLSADEAWYAVHDSCCTFHPCDPADPRTAAAARAGIARRLDFLCRWLPSSCHAVPPELAERLRDLRVWRRVIARTYELDPHGPSYEGRVAEALRELRAWTLACGDRDTIAWTRTLPEAEHERFRLVHGKLVEGQPRAT